MKSSLAPYAVKPASNIFMLSGKSLAARCSTVGARDLKTWLACDAETVRSNVKWRDGLLKNAAGRNQSCRCLRCRATMRRGSRSGRTPDRIPDGRVLEHAQRDRTRITQDRTLERSPSITQFGLPGSRCKQVPATELRSSWPWTDRRRPKRPHHT